MIKKQLLLWAMLVFACSHLMADLRFKNIYQTNMVLQADAINTIAGFAEANEALGFSWTATDKGGKNSTKSEQIKADAKGYWEAKIPAMPKRTTLEIAVSNGKDNVSIKNVITGELWIGSGQSNMDWNFNSPLLGADYLAQLSKDADDSNGEIRLFKVPTQTLCRPINDVVGDWVIIRGGNVKGMSAVCFLFAKDIRKKVDTPMGMINTSWGGSRIEPWISKDAFLASTDCKNIWERHVKKIEQAADFKKNYNALMADWLEKYPSRALQNKNNASKPFIYDETSFVAPSAIYNAMVNGIAPLAPKGVLWYQGESNAGEPDEYGKLSKLLVNSWRKHFKTDFYFYYVELAAYQQKQKDPVEGMGRWGYIREAQAAVLELPKTGVAANADQDASPSHVGDIHPPSKDVCASRLANLALAQVYKKIPAAEAIAPFYKSSKVDGNKMTISLEYAEGLRKMKNAETLQGFAMRGDGNNSWVFADAEIKGNQLVISSPKIQKPEAVRYAWAQNPLMSVENKYGLPLRPFSTDNGSQLDYKNVKR